MNDHPEELLPWFVNNTLTGEERRRVERHVAECAHCRAEIELLKAMRREVQAFDVGEGPGELARARLLREVRQTRQTTSRWMPMALAASLAVVALQAALLFWTWTPQDGYTPLGTKPPAEAVLQVRFAPDATERDIRAALASVGGSIVDGPSALGVYRVRLPDAKHAASAAETLRDNSQVITHVEREP